MRLGEFPCNCFCFFEIAAACSSFVQPAQPEGLVDALLVEIQAGRVEAGMGDVVVPSVDSEENQLTISRIPHMNSNTNLTLDSMVGSEFRVTDIPVIGKLRIFISIKSTYMFFFQSPS